MLLSSIAVYPCRLPQGPHFYLDPLGQEAYAVSTQQIMVEGGLISGLEFTLVYVERRLFYMVHRIKSKTPILQIHENVKLLWSPSVG